MDDLILRKDAVGLLYEEGFDLDGNVIGLIRRMNAAAPAVKVKPLVWEGFISGSYRIEVEKGGIARLLYYSAAIFDEEEPEQILGGYLTLVSMDDLKAAAQSHHEARILAALEVSQ